MALSRSPAVDALQTSALLQALREDARFQAVMAEIWRAHRPGLPSFEPKATQEENIALLENMKFSSGMQKGFDLLFALLVGRTM